MASPTQTFQLSDYFETKYHTSVSASAVQAYADSLAYIIAPEIEFTNPEQASFLVSENGHITFRNHLLMAESYNCTPETEGKARQKWEEFKGQAAKRLATENAKQKVSFPDLFRYCVFRNAEAVYHTESKDLLYWKLHFDIELPALDINHTQDSIETGHSFTSLSEAAAKVLAKLRKATLENEWVTAYIGANGYLVGLDFAHLVIESSHNLPILDLKEGWNPITNLVFLRDSITQAVVAMFVGLCGKVKASRLGVERKEEIISKEYEDYYAAIDVGNKEISFFIELFYNKKDTRITDKIGLLNNIWPASVKVPYRKIGDDIEFWTLFFHVKHTPIEVELKSTNPDTYEEEGTDIVRTTKPYGLLLTIHEGGNESGFTEKFVLRIDNDYWKKESTTYSHELGHAFFNSLDILDEYVKSDLVLLPKHIPMDIIKSKLIITGIQNEGTGQQKNPLNDGIDVDSHFDKMLNFMGKVPYKPKKESDGKVKPVMFRPNLGNSGLVWPEEVATASNGNSTNPVDYGYDGIPLMCYGTDNKREIWIFEYRELIRATLLYVNVFMKKVYDVSYKNYPVKKYFIKRRSRIVFWDA